MRFNNYLNEKIEDFKLKEKRNIKKHFKKLQKYFISYQLVPFLDYFNQLYKKEKIKLIKFNDNNDNIVVKTDFFKDMTVILYINKLPTEKQMRDINNKYWNTIIHYIAKTREKSKNINRTDLFNFQHTPIKQYLQDRIKVRAYDAYIEKQEDGFSPTKSIYYDLFGNDDTYKHFKYLMNAYQNNEIIPPPERKLL